MQTNEPLRKEDIWDKEGTDVLLKAEIFLTDDARLLEVLSPIRFLFNILPLVFGKQSRRCLHEAISLRCA